MSDYKSNKKPLSLGQQEKHYESVPLCYIYKKKGLQVVLSRSFEDKENPYKTNGWSVFLVGANILSTENVKDKNPRLDWTNAIRVKLSQQELSNFTRYADPIFVKAFGAIVPALDPSTGEIKKENGKVVAATDEHGRTIYIRESIYHSSDSGSVKFNFVKSKYDYNGAQVFMEKNGNKFNINLDMAELTLFSKCCEFAFNFLCQAAIEEKNGFYESWKKARLKELGKGGSGSSSSDSSDSSDDYEYDTTSSYSKKSYSNDTEEEFSPRPVSYRERLASSGDEETHDFGFGDSLMTDTDGDDIPF